MEDCSKHAFSKYFLLAHKSITHLGQETMRLPSIKCNRGYDSCFYGLKASVQYCTNLRNHKDNFMNKI